MSIGFQILLFFLIAFIALIALAIISSSNQAKKEDERKRAISLAEIDEMPGLEFEHYVAWVLKMVGFHSVAVTTGSRDLGADIIAKQSDNKYCIQVKRQQSRVSRKAISDAVGALASYKCNKAMAITNSYFTKPAMEFVRASDCELVDRDKLADW